MKPNSKVSQPQDAEQPNVITADGEIPSGWFWKTPYNHSTEYEALRSATVNKEPSMTQQHQADEADINKIVQRYTQTGLMPQVPMPPTMQDFDDVWDFQTAMNTIAAAKHSFQQIAPEVRSRFDNDPARFVAYVDEALQSGKLDELRAWGMAVTQHEAPPPETPPKAPEGAKT